MSNELPVRLDLIRKCEERALRIMGSGESVDPTRKRKVRNNSSLMALIQTEFQGAAYTYYLAGRMGLTSFRACLYFDKISTLNLLISMVETQPPQVTVKNLKNMTGIKELNGKTVNEIEEFIFEYRSWKDNKERAH